MKKLFSVLLAVVLLCSILSVVASAEEFQLTLDENNRYTDISYIDGDDAELLGIDGDDDGVGKTVYIAVLSVLLVIAIVVLIVTLKKAKIEKQEYEDRIEEADLQATMTKIKELQEKKAELEKKDD